MNSVLNLKKNVTRKKNSRIVSKSKSSIAN